MYILHQVLQKKGIYDFAVFLQIKRKLHSKISVEYLIYQIVILKEHALKVAGRNLLSNTFAEA